LATARSPELLQAFELGLLAFPAQGRPEFVAGFTLHQRDKAWLLHQAHRQHGRNREDAGGEAVTRTTLSQDRDLAPLGERLVAQLPVVADFE
jgi:hypothetical protein